MIIAYATLFVLVILLFLYVYGVIADKDREIALLKENSLSSAVAMKNYMDWIDDVATMEPLTALKEVQQRSNERNATK